MAASTYRSNVDGWARDGLCTFRAEILLVDDTHATGYYGAYSLRCMQFYQNYVVLQKIETLLCNRRTPQPKVNPTQETLASKWHLGHFFPQQMIFRELGLILYRKQTRRNPTRPNSPQTPYCCYALTRSLRRPLMRRRLSVLWSLFSGLHEGQQESHSTMSKKITHKKR